MPRLARVVIPGYPHHIIQRGNRSQPVFFSDDDKKTYLNFLRKFSQEEGLNIWAYCLMENHIHLLVIPQNEQSLAKGIGKIHRYYSRMINFRQGWRGYLFQGRFSSYVLAEKHLYAVMRYIENNPVEASLVSNPEDYQWSSARAHVLKIKDPILSNNFVIESVLNWKEFLNSKYEDNEKENINLHARTGRPLGDNIFIRNLEKILGRTLIKKRPGPKMHSDVKNIVTVKPL